MTEKAPALFMAEVVAAPFYVVLFYCSALFLIFTFWLVKRFDPYMTTGENAFSHLSLFLMTAMVIFSIFFVY